MIQRRQTLYLLLMIAVSLFMMLADPPLSVGGLADDAVNGSQTFQVRILHIISPAWYKVNYWVLMSLIMICLLSIIAIMTFKKRAAQLKLVAFNFLMIGLSVVFMVYAHFELMKMVGKEIRFEPYYWTWIMPLLLAVLNILSFMGIKKDIELLASVDRLR